LARLAPPPLPPGVRRIVIWPSHRNRACSWGLDYPLVYGFIRGFGSWMVWDRETGVVAAVFPCAPNVHGWSPAEHQAREFADPGGADFNPFELDSVP
jgi:hypothetical protein